MSTAENKKLMQDIFSALSKGDDAPLIEAMSGEAKVTATFVAGRSYERDC